MARPMDSDLHLGNIAVRMGLITPQDLPKLLKEARAGHAEESAGAAGSLAQLLLRKRILSVSDYMYMAQQARDESASPEGPAALETLEQAFNEFQSGELDMDSLEHVIATSGEPLVRPKETSQRFAHYELKEEIARGGMGIVYEAIDTRNGKTLALKVMIEADDDEVRLQRFEREAELAAALEHPHIVKIHDAGRVEGMPYFTMDLIHGDSLDDLLEGAGVPRDLALRALAQIASAVDHAHQRGIVHRDLKPGNILIERKTGIARITDFGLARDLYRGTRLTMVGQAVGTPYYMAPEQVRGERDVDGRCDIYALGVMLYEILTGDVPFDADSPLSLFKKIDREEITIELDPAAGIDEGIRNIALRALAKDRDERYSRGTLFSADLERYLAGQEPLCRPYEWGEGLRRKLFKNHGILIGVVLAAAALAILGLGVGIAWNKFRGEADAQEGRDRLTRGLERAVAAKGKAEEALRGAKATDARDEALAGVRALEDLDALLGQDGPKGDSARRAFHEGGGKDLAADLHRLLARAWLKVAEQDAASRGDATAAVKKALGLLPNDVPLRLELARLLQRDQDLLGAVEALGSVLEIEATHEAALIARGAVYLELGRAEDAVSDLSTALLRRSDAVEALLTRARAYLALGRLEAARQDAVKARDLAASSPEPHLVSGDVDRARRAFTSAFTHYDKAASLAPKLAAPHLRRGSLLLARGSFEAAAVAYQRASERRGGYQAFLGLARTHLHALQLDAAAQDLLRALEASKTLPEREGELAQSAVLTLQGQVHLAAGRRDEGRAALTRAVVRDVLAPRVWLARLDLEQGLANEAAKRLAGLPESDDPDLLALRSRIEVARKHLDQARSLAERAVAATRGRVHPRSRRALATVRLAARVDETAATACEAAWSEAYAGGSAASAYLRQARERVGLALAFHHDALVRQAQRLLRAARSLDPGCAPAWELTGRLALGRKKLSAAWEAYLRANTLDPFQSRIAAGMAKVALQDQPRRRAEQALAALERAVKFQRATPELLALQARCHMRLQQWDPALEALDRALKADGTDPSLQTLRATCLRLSGREAGARLAEARAKQLGPEADARRRDLVAQAKAVQNNDPQKALDLLDEAIRLSDPRRQAELPQMILFRAGLVRNLRQRVESLAQVMVLPRWDLLDRGDQILAPVWTRPLPEEGQRRLLVRTRGADPVADLAVALAGFYDGLAGESGAKWLGRALSYAERAVSARADSLTAHVARAYLRVHTGDQARGLRELRVIGEAAGDSALFQFVLAEAAAANGETRLFRQAIKRARTRHLKRIEQRIAASPFLRGR